MKLFLTGGAGFLGQRVVRQALAGGHDVRCFVRPSTDVRGLEALGGMRLGGRLDVVRGDLGRAAALPAALDGCDAVLHLAAEMRGGTSVLFLNNVVLTRQLLEGIRLAGGVGRLVLVSSLAVYGTGHLRAGDVLDETCPLDPEPHRRDPYTYSKVAQERVAWQAARQGGPPLAVVRPGVIYGPGRECLGNRVGLTVGRFLVRMGGRRPLPYTFVDNCARAVLLAATAAGAEGEAFNVVDDDPPTARQLVRQYRAQVGRVRGVTVPRCAVGLLSGLCEWYHGWSGGQLPAVLTRYKSAALWKPLRYSNAKAKAVLGWAPETDFAAGLRDTFAWLRQQRGGVGAVPA
jgi:nucleoside-diphosphate-sugar epimerase